MASTKRSKSGGGGSTRDGRPRIHSSHSSGSGAAGGGAGRAASGAGAGAPRKINDAKLRAARARAKKAVTDVASANRRDEGGAAAAAAGGSAASAAPRRKPGKVAAEIPSTASDAARELATQVAIEALEKKAVGLEILDVAGRVDYADFLVLMSGRSDRHVVALAQGIEDALKKKGQRPLSIEGLPHAAWVLIDYGDVVVHVFQEDRRHLYNLEGLWMDARRIPLPADAAGPN